MKNAKILLLLAILATSVCGSSNSNDNNANNSTPVAAFTCTADSTGLTIMCDNTTTIEANLALSYAWDFDSTAGPTTDSTDEAPTYTYTSAGQYTIRLTATASNSKSHFAEQMITITSIRCIAGDYDFDKDGVRDLSNDCWPNGNRKNSIGYYYTITYYNTISGQTEVVDGETGGIFNGTAKGVEYTFYENSGNLKTTISYMHSGTKFSVGGENNPQCYGEDGTTQETCTQAKHGCTSTSTTCISQPGNSGAGIECQAGDHDINFDGVRNYSIECWPSGKRKRRISYHPDVDDGIMKAAEYTFYENGNIEAGRDSLDGIYEKTYYENGNRKTSISYSSAGTKMHVCYANDGTTAETCDQAKHGCTSASDTCITAAGPPGAGGSIECQAGDHDINFDGIRDFSIECWPNGKRKKRIGYAFGNDIKVSESTYDENGSRKTSIFYYSNGSKSAEFTYYENGSSKTVIFYNSDGTRSGPFCSQSDGMPETSCTQAKHGCTSASNTCITE